MKKVLECMQVLSGLMLFPLMGIIIALNAMGFNSLTEVIAMF